MALYVIVEYINHICIVIADFYAFIGDLKVKNCTECK